MTPLGDLKMGMTFSLVEKEMMSSLAVLPIAPMADVLRISIVLAITPAMTLFLDLP